MASKKALKKRIRLLEAEVELLRHPSGIVTASVILGSTGGPAQAISWPIRVGGRRTSEPLDLPALGYSVEYTGSDA